MELFFGQPVTLSGSDAGSYVLQDKVLDDVPGPDLVRMSTANTAYRSVVAAYVGRKFDLDTLLSRFFNGVELSMLYLLQKHLGVVISGSVALQFFDRSTFEGSDLDLYVMKENSDALECWLQTIGYTIVEKPAYVGTSITGVTTFGRYRSGVQVISTRNTVVETILEFSLTCVMNLITYFEAICIYPRATFVKREALLLNSNLSLNGTTFIDKYRSRGWTIICTLDPLQQFDTDSDFYCPPDSRRTRAIGDDRCWVIPLRDMTSPPTSDLKFVNTWRLTYRDSPYMSFTILRHDRLLHSYVITLDPDVVRHIYDVLDEQHRDLAVQRSLRLHFHTQNMESR
ncbi:hypothetical protein BDN72DRAFT_903337 [Pluteus cervinus]|uniref:Uncharacterized protein n=1 Tax=Pluteus cervinus TaxID=181527 RepID=A0ACD3A9G6_9AGAR|nr:hypothetical protein BDN72DRAFT_903337 [Pluteus cervinus]